MVNLPSPITVTSADLLGGNTTSLDGIAGVYSFVLGAGDPHFGWSKNLGKRLARLARSLQAGMTFARSSLQFDFVHCWPTHSQLEQLIVLYLLTKQSFPGTHMHRLRIRRPWFVSLLDEENWARVGILQRISSSSALQLGPFQSRDAAAQYEEAASALFHLRRCIELIHPNPANPGCIYGEIGQCSRPCQAAVEEKAYANEVVALNEILTEGPATYLAHLTARRQQASEDLDFEGAAALHKRWERAQRLSDLHESDVRLVSSFHGVALTPSNDVNKIRIWPMKAALWRESLQADRTNKSEMSAVFDRITALFALRDNDDTPPLNEARIDHLALYLRWHRSSFHKEIWMAVPSSGLLRKASFTRATQRVVSAAT